MELTIPEEVGQSSNEELSFFASVDVEYSDAKLRELSSSQENNVYSIVPLRPEQNFN